jgi:hypothetical protein
MRIATCWIVACTVCLSGTTFAFAATIDFEPPAFPLGTAYGTPAGHVPGNVVFNVCDVETSVQNFHLGAFVGFNFAEIAGHPGPPTSFFPAAVNSSQVLQINNINIFFDFRSMPQTVTSIRFDYVDVGGEENFDLNMTGLQEITKLSVLAPVPGFTINVTETPFGGGSNIWGRVSITADAGNKIETLLIGGQEFAIDNLQKLFEDSADFDEDGDVDGNDYLNWQRGKSPNQLSVEDLALWKDQFGTTSTLSVVASIPEPNTFLLGALAAVGLLVRRR